MSAVADDSAWPATIPALIRACRADSPDSPAFMDASRTIDHRALADLVDDLVHAFRTLGVAPGGCIALFLEGTAGIDGLVLSIAATCAGTVAILAAEPPAAWRARMIERLRPDLVVLRDGLSAGGIDAPIVRYAPGPALLTEGSAGERGPVRRLDPTDDPAPDATAFIMATSGTTGEPRLVPMPHRMVLTDAAATMPTTDFGPDDRILLLGAPSHAIAIWVYTALWHRASTVVGGLAGADEIAELCLQHRPTVTGATPMLLAKVGDRLARLMPGPSTSFRLVSSSGASMPTDIRARILGGFRCRLIDEYGSSEALSLSVDGILRYPGVRIADDSGAPLPHGVPGEIQARGENVFPGYVDDPEATALAFTTDGWCRTGDLGLIDDEGRLILLGRLSERINRGGVKIAPLEIEQAALSHSGVFEAAAFPLPHPELGQDVGLAIVLAPGAAVTAREMRRWLLGQLPATHMPRTIRFLDALPRSATGKVARLQLSPPGQAGNAPASPHERRG